MLCVKRDGQANTTLRLSLSGGLADSDHEAAPGPQLKSDLQAETKAKAEPEA